MPLPPDHAAASRPYLLPPPDLTYHGLQTLLPPPDPVTCREPAPAIMAHTLMAHGFDGTRRDDTWSLETWSDRSTGHGQELDLGSGQELDLGSRARARCRAGELLHHVSPPSLGLAATSRPYRSLQTLPPRPDLTTTFRPYLPPYPGPPTTSRPCYCLQTLPPAGNPHPR